MLRVSVPLLWFFFGACGHVSPSHNVAPATSQDTPRGDLQKDPNSVAIEGSVFKGTGHCQEVTNLAQGRAIAQNRARTALYDSVYSFCHSLGAAYLQQVAADETMAPKLSADAATSLTPQDFAQRVVTAVFTQPLVVSFWFHPNGSQVSAQAVLPYDMVEQTIMMMTDLPEGMLAFFRERAASIFDEQRHHQDQADPGAQSKVSQE